MWLAQRTVWPSAFAELCQEIKLLSNKVLGTVRLEFTPRLRVITVTAFVLLRKDERLGMSNLNIDSEF